MHLKVTIIKFRPTTAGLIGLLLIIILNSCQPAKKQYYFDVRLNSGWKFRKSGDEKWLAAYVPGSIASDLLINKKISGPFIRIGTDSLQWVYAAEWEYRNMFLVDPNILLHDSVYLVFKGLNGNASVYLNDSLILKANNVFKSWNVDCKALLKETENNLRIVFSPYVIQVSKPGENPQSIISDCTPSGDGMYNNGMQFYTGGICRSVYLQAWSIATIDDVYLYPEQIVKKSADYKARYLISSSKNQNVEIEVLIDNKVVKPVETVQLIKGLNEQTTTFTIVDPKLWWTNGLGNPHLYNFTLRVKKERTVINEKQLRFGVRTIELVQKSDSLGKEMYFKLNGAPVFIKGVNYVPNTMSASKPGEQYQILVENARLSNINAFWMSGGDIQENDAFYDLCDENGIMVCKDLPLSSSLLARKKDNYENVRQIVSYTVKRLRNHACLSLWSSSEGQTEDKRIRPHAKNNTKTFVSDAPKPLLEMLPDWIKDSDPQTDYWSPNRIRPEDKVLPKNIKNKFKKYVVFENEKLSLPSNRTLKTLVSEANVYMALEKRLKAPSHQLSGFNNNVTDIILENIVKGYKQPKDIESFVYLSQLVQADNIKTAIEHSRKDWPNCTGWMYTQFNECFPSISGSTIDYFGRWKLAQYTFKNSFTHFLVIPAREDNMVKIYGVSDAFKDIEAILLAKLIDFKGKVLYVKQIPVILMAGSSNLLLSVREPEMLNKAVRTQCCLVVQLNAATSTLSQNIMYFSEPKNLVLPKSKLTIDINETGKGFHVILKSDQLMKNVCLETKRKDSFFSDNNFDLLPEKRTKITVQYPGTKIELLSDLNVRSLVDAN